MPKPGLSGAKDVCGTSIANLKIKGKLDIVVGHGLDSGSFDVSGD